MRPNTKQLLLATTALVPFAAQSVSANPTGASVAAGTAAIGGEGTANLTVQQSTTKAIVNWRSFDIGKGETTTFIQPSANAVTLNRVNGNRGPSQIEGALKANGQVFLINPDGILFGAQSTVDAAGLVATTNDIADGDFLAGRYAFGTSGKPDASVVNEGTITATTGGFAALVAPGVRNTGAITATLGTVALASGNGFSLDFYGDQLITLSVDDSVAATVKDAKSGQTLDALVKNEGTIRANGGTVQLSAAAARRVVDSVINNTGVIEANSVGLKNGKIILGAATAGSKPQGTPTQTVKVSGILSAKGAGAGESGGKVQITGEAIKVAGAKIDASGTLGGGTVLIGGDLSGGRPNPNVVIPRLRPEPIALPTASTVMVDASSTINASAIDKGAGGKVIAWADESMSFGGAVAVRGGAATGDGGGVEVSGKEKLTFSGSVDLAAPQGEAGTLLLDPLNVTIGPTGLTVATLTEALASGDVIVSTDVAGGEAGDITVAAAIDWSSANTLSLNATKNIAIEASISAPSGGLSLSSGGTVTASASVSVDRFTLNSGAWNQLSANLSGFSARDFRLSGGSFLRAVGGAGTTASPYQIADIYGIQGIASPTLLGSSFALAGDVNATGTATWNLGAGFDPIGTSIPFSGTFDGNGHTLSGLTVNKATDNAGLFAQIGSTGTVRNLNLANVYVAGGSGGNVGAVAGLNEGLIDTVTVTGLVTGGRDVPDADGTLDDTNIGGVAGTNLGSVTGAQVAASIVGRYDSNVGGVIGLNTVTIENSAYVTSIMPTNVVSTPLPHADSYGIVVAGNYAYVASNFTGLSVFDLTDDLHPVLVAAAAGPSRSAHSVLVSGNYAYVGTGDMGLAIFDVSNPTNPVFVSQIQDAGDAFDLAISGNILIYPDVNIGRVRFVDITDPENPTIVGTLAVTTSTGQMATPTAVAVVSGDLLIADQTAGELLVADFANPAAPIEISSTAPSSASYGAAYGIATLSGYAYVPDGGGLQVYNITNPEAPLSVGGLPNGGYYDAQIAGGYLYLTTSGAIVKADITNPSTPTVVGYTAVAGSPRGIAAGPDGSLLIANSAQNILSFNAIASGAIIAGSSGAVGGLVGNNRGQVARSFATGGIYAPGTGLDQRPSVGGLVGTNSGQITDAFADTSTFAVNDHTLDTGHTGGLVGLNDELGSIINSFSSGQFAGSFRTARSGGLAGANAGFIANSFSDINDLGGGLVGSNSGSISGSFATGEAYSGGLVAMNTGSIVRSFATGDVVGLLTDFGGVVGNGVGGLVGANEGTIALSFATGDVVGNSYGTNVGGLVGFNEGTVAQSYATGAVSGQPNGFTVGGLVGHNCWCLDEPALISQSYAAGSVTIGWGSGGGLVGINSARIESAYATGDVNGSVFTDLGALVGYFFRSGSITASYGTGFLSGGDRGPGSPWLTGGLVGHAPTASAVNSYWDVTSTGQPTSPAGATGLTTTQLQTGLPAGFDATVWGSASGSYPYLLWQTAGAVPVVQPSGTLPTGFGASTWTIDPVTGNPKLAWAESATQLSAVTAFHFPSTTTAVLPAPTTTTFVPPFEVTPPPPPPPLPPPQPPMLPPDVSGGQQADDNFGYAPYTGLTKLNPPAAVQLIMDAYGCSSTCSPGILSELQAIAAGAVYAEMANAAYSQTGWAPSGWRVIGGQSSTTGMSATLFQNFATGEVVVSFRGTLPSSKKDTDTDAALVFGQNMNNLPEMQAALQYAMSIQRLYGTVTFTGHSLGGSMAEYAATQLPISSVRAIAFDPVPISPSLLAAQATEVTLGPPLPFYSNITSFRGPDDPATGIGAAVSGIVTGSGAPAVGQPIISVMNTPTALAQLRDYAAFIRGDNTGPAAFNHSIDKLMSAMQAVRFLQPLLESTVATR